MWLWNVIMWLWRDYGVYTIEKPDVIYLRSGSIQTYKETVCYSYIAIYKLDIG